MAANATTDLLLAESDVLSRTRFQNAFQIHGLDFRVSAHGSARGAITAFTRARFDAIVVGSALEEIDTWRFLRMVRSGRFGFAEVPAFLIAPPEDEDSFLPMLDPFTKLLSAVEIEKAGTLIRESLTQVHRDRVLIVEDEPFAAAAAQRALAKYFQTDVAQDGETAIALWRHTAYDLVLLDLMLPGVPGRQVLTTMLASNPHQVVVVLTAHDDTDHHQDLVLAGASDFLAKPIDVHFLADTCARVLRESRQMTTIARKAVQDRQLQEIAARVHAATYSLNRGQTAHATRHLNHAVRACRFNTPNDDQWTTLLTDFS